MSKPNSSCPCGSSVSFEKCCQHIISGKSPAKTATDLLKARYSAFAVGEIDYILKTHHSKTVKEVKREEIEDWSKNSEWLGLEVIQTEAGTEADEKGSIVFCARYQQKNEEKVSEHWEQSFFEKENGAWRFLDARAVKQGTYVREQPKVGRNDACPCKSGKKYKKCCGAAA